MANTLAILKTYLTADTSKFRKELTGAAKFAQTMGPKLQKTGARMSVGMTLPLAAMGTYAIKNYMEAEETAERLKSALAASGQEVDDNFKKFSSYAESIQKVTTYEDDAIIAGQALATNMGLKSEQMEGATKTAVALSAAYKMDLNEAFQLVAKAANGNTQALKRRGIFLDENATKEEQFQQLMQKGSDLFKVAEAEVNTTSGKLKILNRDLGNTSEEFGKALVPALTAVLDTVRPLVEYFNGMSESSKQWLVYFGMIAAASGPVLAALGSLSQAYAALTVRQLASAAAAEKAAAASVAGGAAGAAGGAAGGLLGKARMAAGAAGAVALPLAIAAGVGYAGGEAIDYYSSSKTKSDSDRINEEARLFREQNAHLYDIRKKTGTTTVVSAAG